uniref:Uncharacterized protein n=1 Tax=Oryza brachyantha TaxID=4533 RepID=J3LXH6_ORYBR
MDVFIHEDYVNRRNEVRREQRRKQMQLLQVEQALAEHGVSRPAPAPRESRRVPAQCLTPTGGPSITVRSPAASSTAAAAAGEGG